MLPTARGPRCGQAGRTQRPRSLRSAPDTSEEQLAANVDMWWHLTAAELECGVIDETGEYVGGKIDWKRKMDGYRDWMRRHPGSRAVWETARFHTAVHSRPGWIDWWLLRRRV